jgi:hypothetical protein
MEYLSSISTQFVRDRLRETSWANRQYIEDLYRLERFLKQGIGGLTSAYLFKSLSDMYPVERECIKRELTTGELTSPPEFARLKRERQEWEEAQRAAAEEALARQQEEEERRNLSIWLKLGGQA